jgi:hypothetical protein
VHRPELAGERGGLRRDGRGERERVHVREREVPEGEDHGVAESGADLVEDRDGRAAVRALVVAVLDEAGRGAEDAQ